MTEILIAGAPAPVRKRVIRSTGSSASACKPANDARTDWLLIAMTLMLAVTTVISTWAAVDYHQAMRDMASRSQQQLVCFDYDGSVTTELDDRFAVCEKVTIVRHKRDTLVLN